jgi:APA family basic amino acid/polyamine antiporter
VETGFECSRVRARGQPPGRNGERVADAPQTNRTADHPAEHRKFGYWAGYFVVVGSMIGAGILTTSGFILRDTGNAAALLGLWALGGLLALCGAVTIAELATKLPHSGGDYVFVREGFGRGAGFVSGWATFTLGFAAPTAVIAVLAVEYLTRPYATELTALLPAWAAAHLVPLGASAIILAVGLIHTLGHHHSSGLQFAATATTGCVLVGIAVGGVLFGAGDWKHVSDSSCPTGSQWPALSIGLIYVCYAYAGWNGAAYLAGEIRDPVRTLPRCLIGGAATVMVLYLLVNLAYVYALDPGAMARKSDDEVRPVAKLAVAVLFGETAARVIAVALGLTLLAAVSAYILTGPRVAYAMARDGMFPAFAGRLHPTRETPAAAVLTQTLVAGALVWVGSFHELLDYASVGLVALTGLTIASVFPLRRRADLPPGYRLPLYPLPPLTFLVLAAWTVGYTLYKEVVLDGKFPGPALLSLVTLFVGVPISRLMAERTKS